MHQWQGAACERSFPLPLPCFAGARVRRPRGESSVREAGWWVETNGEANGER